MEDVVNGGEECGGCLEVDVGGVASVVVENRDYSI